MVKARSVYILPLDKLKNGRDVLAIMTTDCEPQRNPLPHGDTVTDTLESGIEGALTSSKPVISITNAINADPYLAKANAAYFFHHPVRN